MTFQELVAAVVLETARGDMGFVTEGGDGRIPQAVKRALNYLHGYDKFWRDLRQTAVSFSSAAYTQSVDTQEDLTRFRQVSFIIGNPGSGVTSLLEVPDGARFTQRFELLDPSALLFPGRIIPANSYYVAGSMIALRSTVLSLENALIGYYAFPNLDYTSDGGVHFDSWVARDYPWVAIAKATSDVFSVEGKQEMARKMDSPIVGQYPQLLAQMVSDNIEMEAR
jgi:hypothetical protein